MSAEKKIVIIAGPNGAGKTTFAFETTLAGHTYIRRVRSWHSAGFVVKVLFLSLRNPEEAIARVALRVQQGGHDVPSDVIRRRFVAGMKNFMDVYRFEVDYWRLFDNSGSSPVLLSQGG